MVSQILLRQSAGMVGGKGKNKRKNRKNMSELLISTIKPELLVLVPVLYLIGTAIKKSKFLNDNIIPLLLGFIGIALSTMYICAAADTNIDINSIVFSGITQGILCAGATVYINQIIKQINK